MIHKLNPPLSEENVEPSSPTINEYGVKYVHLSSDITLKEIELNSDLGQKAKEFTEKHLKFLKEKQEIKKQIMELKEKLEGMKNEHKKYLII